MDFNEIKNKAAKKKAIPNKMTDKFLFELDGRRIMATDMENYFSKRGRKTAFDRKLFKAYQEYAIKQVKFEISVDGSLGDVIYNTGETRPTICIVDGYRYSEGAIAHMNTIEERSPQSEVAVLIGKALELIPLGEEENIAQIKKLLNI